ncbi:hypothetical protein OU995_21450 [Roseateles sp. SL47]|uniref:hypothetical protein n=1 Tax=Roseateles sp. SL47 TaxID=2995138 RepID=UPI00227056EF|nr:hypothetical protein [Roseateles sp. SL47]WAC72110.1 hypothetical protein OU995_21450 [Roseateles sp. SL47]
MSIYTLNTDSILEAAVRAGATHNNGAEGQFLICATEKQLRRFASTLTSLEDLRTALLNPPPVARDENGYWTNPALPDVDESVNLRLLCEAFGLDFAVEWAESQVSEERWEAWSNGAEHLADWNPEPPAGDGWVLLSIHDTEDGPVALYVRQMPREPESIGRTKSMTAEEMRPHFEWWYTTRGVYAPIGSRECAAAWGAWLASGHYTAPGGWKVSPMPWGLREAASPAQPVVAVTDSEIDALIGEPDTHCLDEDHQPPRDVWSYSKGAVRQAVCAARAATAKSDALHERLSEREALLSSLEELTRKHQYHLERSAQRSQRLWQWAHEELTEPLKTRYFNIVANGTADVMESPTYAQQYNLLRHRLDECADVLSWLYASLPMNAQDTQRVGRILGRARAAQSIFPATFTPPPTSPAPDAPERNHG